MKNTKLKVGPQHKKLQVSEATNGHSEKRKISGDSQISASKKKPITESDPSQSESYDSENEYVENRRGAVPQKWYEDEKHVGYTVTGKKIARKASADKIDQFINKSENPDWWRTIKDELNQKDVVLTDKQLEALDRIREGKFYSKKMEETNYTYDLDEEDLKRFIHPFHSEAPAKRKFTPSKHERIKINK